jgi:MtN3 and saliva related transmembrane protein
MLINAIGAAAAVLTTFSFVPQIIKVYRNKSAKDVSLVTLVQLSSGVFLWVIYGLYRRDPIIIAANTVTFISLAVLVFFYFIYNKRI